MNESRINSKEKTFYIDLNSDNIKFKDKIVNLSCNKVKKNQELSHIKVSKNDELRQNMIFNLKKTVNNVNSSNTSLSKKSNTKKIVFPVSVNVSKITTKNNSRESSKRNMLEDKFIKVTRKPITSGTTNNNFKINVKRNGCRSNYYRNNQENCNEIKDLKEYESYITTKKNESKENSSSKVIINRKNDLNIKQIAKKYYQQLAKNKITKNNGLSGIHNEKSNILNKSHINILRHKKDAPGNNLFNQNKKFYLSYNNSRNNSLLNLNNTNNTQINTNKLNTQIHTNTQTQDTCMNKSSIKRIVTEQSKLKAKNNKNYSNQSYSDLLTNLKKDFILSSNKSDHFSPFKNKNNLFYNLASKRLSNVSHSNLNNFSNAVVDKSKNNNKRNTKLYKQSNYELNKSLEEYLLYEKRINLNSRNQGKDIYDIEDNNDKFSENNYSDNSIRMKEKYVDFSNEIINGNTNSNKSHNNVKNTESIENNVEYLNMKSKKDIEKYKLDNSLIQFYKNNSNTNLNDNNSKIIENLNSIDLEKQESIIVNKRIRTYDEINENKLLVEKLNINTPEELHIVLNLLFIKTKAFAFKFENLGKVILSRNNSLADSYVDTKFSNLENGKDKSENKNAKEERAASISNPKKSNNSSLSNRYEKDLKQNLEFYDSDAEMNKKKK